MNYNKVILAGHITRDPEIRTVQGGQDVTNWTIATTHSWKSANGEKREDTAFVDCEIWGTRAQFVASHFAKGQAMLVEGRLKQDNWEDKDGNRRSKLKISVEDVKFVGGGGNGQNRNQGNAPARRIGGVQADNIDVPF